MPRRSKVELSNETVQELENQFFSFLNSLTPQETKKFYSEFLTTEEKMMMYKRLALYWSLFEGYSLASIQRMLGVTHDTTRLYNKKKNDMSQEFKDIVHRIGRTTEAAEHKEPEKMEAKEEPAPAMDEPKMEQEKEEEKIEEAKEEMVMEEKNEEVPEESPMETTEEPKMEEEKQEEMEMKNEEPMHAEKKEMEEEKNEETEIDRMSAQNEEERQQASESEDKNEDENDEENNGGEKKKKGFGRFFGF